MRRGKDAALQPQRSKRNVTKRGQAMQFSIKRRDTQTPARIVESADLLNACEDLSESGKYPLDVSQVALNVVSDKLTIATPVATPVKQNSTFDNGKLVHDAEAKARIEAQPAALETAGIKVNSSEQLYATGTRMADVGYSTQRARFVEHNAKLPAREAAAALVAM